MGEETEHRTLRDEAAADRLVKRNGLTIWFRGSSRKSPSAAVDASKSLFLPFVCVHQLCGALFLDARWPRTCSLVQLHELLYDAFAPHSLLSSVPSPPCLAQTEAVSPM